ncbi:hypothetical protein B0A52_00408 [Exophiala mesophila]|uniref:Deacetylase sirtuin-type domain-containing protein n=1 Tax=Exophiala mesophila TaxID=212818 RepID=A0A438NJZ3_EXOME|nr:hypothetical protein B0A52_00408 [Exophiala mesophila]
MGLQEISSADDKLLQEIADILAGSHKILLVTGAGISTSCGIPDFRSKDGLYNIIPDQSNLPPTPPPSEPSTPRLNRVDSIGEANDFPSSSQSSTASTSSRRASVSPSSRLRGQDLFDSRVFHSAASTTIFYQFIASLREKIKNEVQATSSVHKFVRVLRDGGRLMRCYTQNIDGLEAREGLVTDLTRGKVCAAQFEWTEEETEIYLEGAAPSCQKCKTKSDARQASGKRGLTTGSLRPNIVLYGEEHPSNSMLTPLIPFDASCQPEVMVIMGTSLKVFGLQKMVREFAKAIHAQKKGKGRVIFVNRTRPAESVWDGIIDDFVAMDCDDWVEDLKRRRPDLWRRQGDLALTVTKSSQAKKKRKSNNDEDTENQPPKRVKFTVEIESMAPRAHTPSTPSRKILVPRPKRSPFQVARPPFSPLTSPVRPPISPLTSPVRPPMSPLTSPVKPDDLRQSPGRGRGRWSPWAGSVPGSKLRGELFRQDDIRKEMEQHQTPSVVSTVAPLPRPDKAWVSGNILSGVKEAARMANIGSRLRAIGGWQPGLKESPQPTVLNEEDFEGDTIEVDTPSRGPRGRKIDVFGEAQ